MDLRCYVLAVEGEVPKAGLTLTDFKSNVWRIKKQDKSVFHLVTDGAMQFEVGGGFYGYYLDSLDYVIYDYLTSIQYLGTAPLDVTLWSGSFDLLAGDLRIYFLASESSAPKPGLALSDFQVNIFRIKKTNKSSSQLVTNGAVQFEIGGGFYGYYLLAPDFIVYDYLVSVKYIGVEALDNKLWEGHFSYQEAGPGLPFYITRSTLGEGIGRFQRGESVICNIVIRDKLNTLVDPDTLLVSIWDSSNSLKVDNQPMVKDDTGSYHYSYVIPITAPTGSWRVRYLAQVGAYISAKKDSFSVLRELALD